MFIPSVRGGAAWTAEVTIARRVQPPSQPPPAGGRRRVPAPGGGGSGTGRSPCPRSRGAGGTPALPGHGHWAWCAMRMTVSREPTPSARGVGKPGFPMPPPAGGCGRAQPSQEQLYVHCGVVRPSRMEGCGEHGPLTSPSQGRGNRVAPCPGLPGFPAFRRQLEEDGATRLPHPPAHRGHKRRHPARRAPEQSGRPGPRHLDDLSDKLSWYCNSKCRYGQLRAWSVRSSLVRPANACSAIM